MSLDASPSSLLTQRLVDRIIDSELTRRLAPLHKAGAEAPGPELIRRARPGPELPPATVLGARSFPRPVLERRLRFMRVVGWLPEGPSDFEPGADSALPIQASLEDWVAALYGAATITTSDPVWGGLASSVRHAGKDSDHVAAGIAALDAFFDGIADEADPHWRRTERPSLNVPAWSRLEAVTVGADRWFGRSRSGTLWSLLADGVGRIGEEKRRRWA